MGYYEIDKLEQIVCDDIRKITDKGEIQPQDYPRVGEAVDILKDISEMRKGEEEMMSMRGMRSMNNGGGYSNEGSYAGGSYYGNMSYEGMSGRRGRNAMGQFTSNAGGNYSQHDENQPMIQKLRQKMGSATNEADRQAIQRTISMLEME